MELALPGHQVRTIEIESLTSPVTRSRILAAVLILAAVVAYLPAISAGFIWDDDILLTANPQMHSLQGLAHIWSGKNTCDYTPLTLTTFWLEHQLWQNTPIGYHLVNILLHGIAAILLWRSLVVLQIPGAWLGAFLFTIHPVNVASVAWIAERKNTLSAALFFASILLFVAGYKRNDARRLWASAGFFLLAGLSKGAVVGMPLVLAGCVVWMNRKVTRRDVLSIAPFAVIAVSIAIVTMHFQAAATDYRLDSSSFIFRAARAGSVPWLYLRDIMLPTGLSPISPIWKPDLHSPLIYLFPLLLGSIIVWFFRNRDTWGTPLLLASGYYIWMLLPVTGIIWMAFQQQAACADWWQYLAAPGIFAAVAAGFAVVVRGGQTGRAICSYALLGLAVSLLLVQTWRRCAIYQSTETYARAVLAENPHVWSLQNNLGIVLKERGELDKAEACYRAALSDNPRYVQAHNNLGNLLQQRRNWQESEAEFRMALRLEPRNSEILANLSQTYLREGRIRDALATNAEAIKVDPTNADRYAEFAVKLSANKQFDRAAVCFQNALVLRPGDIRIRFDLARTLIAAGRPQDAAAVCDAGSQIARKSGNPQIVQMFAMLRDQCHPPAE